MAKCTFVGLTVEQAKTFASWFEGQGEQDCEIWFEAQGVPAPLTAFIEVEENNPHNVDGIGDVVVRCRTPQ